VEKMNKTYEDGLRDGQITALETTQGKHSERLDSHSRRLSKMEKVIYAGIGGLLILQGLPELASIVQALVR
jgi:hypothetical protein